MRIIPQHKVYNCRGKVFSFVNLSDMVFTAALLYNGILSYYLVSSSDKINFTARLLHFAKHVGSGLPRIIKLQKTNRWESDCNKEITRDLGNHIDMRIKDNQKNVDPGHPGNSDLTVNF